MKKWEIVNKLKSHPPVGGSNLKTTIQNSKINREGLIDLLLENRGIKTKKEKEEFLNPKLESLSAKIVGIDSKQLDKAIKRIFQAIERQEKIIVFGDYDVDGICSAAILWESLNNLGANALPYIPHRVDEGYGLSAKVIQNSEFKIQDVKLIITVDNGIVANKAVEFANNEGIDVIITDHHLPGKELPKALAIIHTTKVCGAGVAWLLSQEFKVQSSKFKNNGEDNHLELVALATIADMMPLIKENRLFVKFGLEKLRNTKRIGLLELFKEAVIDPKTIDVYQIGHMVAPRINAMGRLEYATDSLRLLCTPNLERAKLLAQKLGQTNRERQNLTMETLLHAKTQMAIRQPADKTTSQISNLLFIEHESYPQGVIGLVAGKLADEFYRPTIVVAKGEKISKASARSIHGFNIIEFIRSAGEHLVEAGGHPMAAGFTVETEKLVILKDFLQKRASELLDEEKFKRVVRVDCELPFDFIDQKLYEEIKKLAPFGVGNPEPTFVSKKVNVEEVRIIGRDGKHLKFKFKIQKSKIKITSQKSKVHSSDVKQNSQLFEAVGFGMGERVGELRPGSEIDIVYTIDENEWNGNKNLQLKLKDFRPIDSI